MQSLANAFLARFAGAPTAQTTHKEPVSYMTTMMNEDIEEMVTSNGNVTTNNTPRNINAVTRQCAPATMNKPPMVATKVTQI